MNKYFKHKPEFNLVLTLVLVTSTLLVPEIAHAEWYDFLLPSNVFASIAEFILRGVSLITGIAGVILNGVIYYTVGQMSQNYTQLTTINSAWQVLRDLANMSFIFVLLYAAIQTILGIGGDAKKLVVNVIVVAILINFSLFFTKVVIDVSNVLAIFFYDAIAPGALNPNLTASQFLSLTQNGLSNAFMNNLNLQSLYDVRSGLPDIAIVSIMGAIMLLIASFVFFAAALMFIIRYVVLILVLILSPIAFMSYVLPGLKSYGQQWKDALFGQAFFAPIFMIMIWITIHVLSGVNGSGGITGAIKTTFGVTGSDTALSGIARESVSPGSFALLINFIIVIVFLIASLIISKKWSDKTSGGMSKLTGWASAATMGGMAAGTAGWAGRNTAGRAGQAFGESEMLKNTRTRFMNLSEKGGTFKYANKAIGTVGAFAVRETQGAALKAGASSFDIKATNIGKGLGKAGGKGGYEQWRKNKNKKEEDYAKSQAPSEKAKAKAKESLPQLEKDVERYQSEYKAEEQSSGPNSVMTLWRKRNLDQLTKKKTDADKLLGVNKEEMQKREEDALKKDPLIQTYTQMQDSLNRKQQDVEKELQEKQNDINATIIPQLRTQKEQELATIKTQRQSEIETIKTALVAAKQVSQNRTNEIKSEYRDESGKIKPIINIGDDRKKKHAESVEKSLWAKIGGYNYTAAAQIKKGKSAKDSFVEAAKKLADEESGEKAPEDTSTPATSTTPAPTPPPTTPNP